MLGRNPWWFGGVDGEGNKGLPYPRRSRRVLCSRRTGTSRRSGSIGELDGLFDNVRPGTAAYAEDRRRRGTLYDSGPSPSTSFLWFNLNPRRRARRTTSPEPWWAPRKRIVVLRSAISAAPSRRAIDRDAFIRYAVFRGEGREELVQRASPGNALAYDRRSPGLTTTIPLARGAARGALGWKRHERRRLPRTRRARSRSRCNERRQHDAQKCSRSCATTARRWACVDAAPLEVQHAHGAHAQRSRLRRGAARWGSAVPAEPGMGQNTWRSSGLLHYWHIRRRSPTPEEVRWMRS